MIKVSTYSGYQQAVLSELALEGNTFASQQLTGTVEAPKVPTGEKPASAKSLEYMIKLLSMRDAPDTLRAEAAAASSQKQVSKVIDALVLCPWKSSKKAKNDVHNPAAEGFYCFESNFYKVNINVNTGHPNAYKLNHQTGKWEYAKGMIYKLAGAPKLHKEQAAHYGHLYGKCMICSKPLSNPESIEQGIGPICIAKMGW